MIHGIKRKEREPMFTILGLSVVLIIEHLTMEQVGTFMARNGDKIGNVLVVNEETNERRKWYEYN